MGTDDDLAYRRSVRNMSLILAVMAVVIFAAIFVPPYINPSHDLFQQSVSFDSPAGFTMHLTLNATSIPPAGSVLMEGWVNGSSPAIENLTVADQWAFEPSLLWGIGCTSGWPIGIGVMAGHYNQDNYTLGTLIQMSQMQVSCPVSPAPQFILLYPPPHSSQALASVNQNPVHWLLQTDLTFSANSLGTGSHPGSPVPSELAPGVYTAVLADEWGDVLTSNFIVS